MVSFGQVVGLKGHEVRWVALVAGPATAEGEMPQMGEEGDVEDEEGRCDPPDDQAAAVGFSLRPCLSVGEAFLPSG